MEEKATITVMSLNVWGGRLLERLIPFLSEARGYVDVFCFQEMCHSNRIMEWSEDKKAYLSLLSEIELTTRNHLSFPAFVVHGWGYSGPVEYHLERGLAMFVRRDLQIIGSGWEMVHGHFLKCGEREESFMPRNIQWVDVAKSSGPTVRIYNFHGLWNMGGPKTDTPARIKQSERIVEVFRRHGSVLKVICGDFNLLPDTRSYRMIAEGFQDLVAVHGVIDTRTSHYKKQSRFADYILASPGINLGEFEVIATPEVSDHKPLLLSFRP